MGMCATLEGRGGFASSIVEHLDFPKKFYSSTAEGYPVTVTFFECHDAATSKQLSSVFGVNPGNPGTFLVNSFPELKYTELFSLVTAMGSSDTEAFAEIAGFIACLDAGFEFLYRPNG